MHCLLCAAPSMLHSSSQPSLYVAGVAALKPFRTVCIPRLFKQSRPKHCEVMNGEGRLVPALGRTHATAHVFTCNRLVHTLYSSRPICFIQRKRTRGSRIKRYTTSQGVQRRAKESKER